MEFKRIESYSSLQQALKSSKRSYLLIYKSGAEQSECAFAKKNKSQYLSDIIFGG